MERIRTGRIRIERRVQEPHRLTDLSIHQRHQRGPQRRHGAGPAEYRGTAVHVYLVASRWIGIA